MWQDAVDTYLDKYEDSDVSIHDPMQCEFESKGHCLCEHYAREAARKRHLKNKEELTELRNKVKELESSHGKSQKD